MTVNNDYYMIVTNDHLTSAINDYPMTVINDCSMTINDHYMTTINKYSMTIQILLYDYNQRLVYDYNEVQMALFACTWQHLRVRRGLITKDDVACNSRHDRHAYPTWQINTYTQLHNDYAFSHVSLRDWNAFATCNYDIMTCGTNSNAN